MELRHIMDNWTMLAFQKESRHPKLISADSRATIRSTLQLMHENNILSVPVANTQLSPALTVGIVDAFDILSYLIEQWDDSVKDIQEHPDRILQTLFMLDQQSLNHPIADLPDRSDNNLFAAVVQEESALRLLKLYGLGVHRVALVDMQGDVKHIVSQSDFINFLDSRKELLGPTAYKTVQELGLIRDDELITVDSEQPVIEGFRALVANNISAVPVVNSQGTLAGTLSISDVRALRTEPLSSLLQPIRLFKEIGGGNAINVVCRPHNTLSDVLALLAETQLHRVWITNEADTPVSVISLTTICDFIATLCGVE